MSGGLGGSQYVKTKIEEYFHRNPRQIAHRIRILKSQEPRLSVVKGLVIDRRQRIKVGSATLKTRVFVSQTFRILYDGNTNTIKNTEQEQVTVSYVVKNTTPRFMSEKPS